MHGQSDAQTFAHALASEWTLHTKPVVRRDQEWWLHWFRVAVHDLGHYVTNNDHEPLPEYTLEIWRGVARAQYARGMSWTLNRNTAIEFANRNRIEGVAPRLYHASVEPSDVLAYFPDEQEIVIDPAILPPLRDQFLA